MAYLPLKNSRPRISKIVKKRQSLLAFSSLQKCYKKGLKNDICCFNTLIAAYTSQY